MKRTFAALAAVLVSAAFALAAASCVSEWRGDEGVLVISFGGGENRSLPSGSAPVWPPSKEEIARMEIKLVLDGPGGKRALTVAGKTSTEIRLDTGRWSLAADAFVDGELRAASGPVFFDVMPGKNHRDIMLKKPPVSGVTLDRAALTITVGGSQTLTAALSPPGAKNQGVTWSSGDASVAAVNNGVVTGVAAGTAAITVTTAAGGFTAACAVTVVEPDGVFVEFDRPIGEDFITGVVYQSNVIMTVKRRTGGVVAALDSAETVTWTVTSEIDGSILFIDPTNGVWKRASNALNGLSWGSAAQAGPGGYDQGATSWNTNAIMGTDPSGTVAHTAHLTDVVGSRTITVTATASGGGTPIASSFTFGKGPLSVFSKTLANGSGIEWAGQFGDNASGGFQDPANTFPAAAFCGGTVDTRHITTTGNASPVNSGFNPNASANWSGEYLPTGITEMSRYAENSRMPTAEQLLAVAGYNGSYNNSVLRKGAALAAGWSLGISNASCHTGEVLYSSGFRAVYIRLSDGDNGWNMVNTNTVGAACLK